MVESGRGAVKFASVVKECEGERDSERVTLCVRVHVVACGLLHDVLRFCDRGSLICVAKKTYVCGKRDLYVWQKRPICVAKVLQFCDCAIV